MHLSPNQHTPPLSRKAQIVRRWIVKALIFVAFAVLVLNPNLKRAALQVRHTLTPDTGRLCRSPPYGINEQIDRFVLSDHGRRSEPRLIAKFVVKKIRYVSDYENWGNLGYWPGLEEVWQRRQEDCDGRAILATSILRSRGYASAHLVIGLDHMWIRVDENEKRSSQASPLRPVLNPNADFSLDLGDGSSGGDLVGLARA